MNHSFLPVNSSPLPTSPLSTPPTPVSVPEPIRILIVDDQNFVRKMLQYSLASVSDFEIIGTAKDGQEALSQVQQLSPDIALVDIEMPGMDGLAITRTLHEQYPQTKVLVISIHDDENYIRDALQAGAKGYLLKNTPPAELAHAIRFVQRGYLQLGPGLFEKLETYPPAPIQVAPPSPIQVAPPITEWVPSVSPPMPLVIGNPGALETSHLDLEWSTTTQETINSVPPLWSHGVLYLMLAFTAVFLPWAAFFSVDEVGVAQGQLDPKGKTIRLDAPVAGTVAAIRTQEGKPVKQGDPLMELQSETVNADLQQAQVKVEGLLNRQTQLISIKAQLENSLSTNRQQIRAQSTTQQAEIDKVQKLQRAQKDELTLKQSLIEKDQAKVKQLSNLALQGAIPRSQAEDAERIMIQNQQQLQNTQAEVEQAKVELQKQNSIYQRILRDGELSILDKTKQIAELQSQITDARSEIGQTQNLMKSLQYQRRQRVLYAPATGTLFQLLIQHPGAVVQAGQAIAQIAPKSARLVFRGRLNNRDTGFLKVGLPAQMKFDAYPFQEYGTMKGKVSWISPTSTPSDPPSSPSSSSPTNNSSSSFEIEIELDQPSLQVQRKAIALKAGQTATAEITIRKRRVLDLLLDPFRKLGKTGLTL